MSNLLKNTLLGLFFGTFGTTIGGLIGIKFNNASNKLLSFILSFASGLMMAIVCFDLIPEALKISDFNLAIVGVIFGIITMIICDVIVQNKLNKKKNNYSRNSLLKTGIAVAIGLALHNLPEGLAIGSGFEASIKLRDFTCNSYCNT